MKELYPKNWPQFYTATIQGWKHLFKEEKYKDVIVNALKHLVENKKVKVNAFVIIDNHIHIILLRRTGLEVMHGYNLKDIQTGFKMLFS